MVSAIDPKDNVIRQNIRQDPRNPKDHLDSGYENSPSLDFTIPPCGIEDIDVAIHRLFDKTIGFSDFVVQSVKGPQQIKKPYVILATGERFALAKKLKPPRDRNKKLVLPAISIRRTGIEQTANDITGRGINQFSGNITIKKHLSAEDRDYQRLVNKQGLQNIQNILGGLPTTTRRTGDLKGELEVVEGGLLENNLSNNNIYEVITIPSPQFFTANYEVIFWTTYTQHMNYLIETYMGSFLPQVRGHKLETDKGYWFVSYTDESFQSSENIEDFNSEERILRNTFSLKVKGYLLAPQAPTNMVPVRRWISAPNISFDITAVNSEIVPNEVLQRPPVKDVVHDGFTLTDIDKAPEISQAPTVLQRYSVKKLLIDPITGKRRIKYVSILDANQKKGETSFAVSDVETLDQYITSFK